MEERYPEWREFYIRYKELKNALYAEREDIEGGEKSGLFVKTLHAEITKVRVLLRVLFRCCSRYLFVSFASSEGIISRWGLDIIPNFAQHLCRDDAMFNKCERGAFSPFSSSSSP